MIIESKEMATFISERVKEVRRLNNKTQTWCATKLGIHRQTYIDMETGKHPPKADTIYNFSVLMGVPISYFFPNSEDKESALLHEANKKLRQLERLSKLSARVFNE